MLGKVVEEEEADLRCRSRIGGRRGRGEGTPEGSTDKISETRLEEASAFSQDDKLY